MSRLNNTQDGEKLAELIDTMRDNVVIVEGKKDKEALYCLGLRNIIAINGKPLVEVANNVRDELANKRRPVVILTDFDHEGRRIAARLLVLLQRLKIHPNARLRNMVMSFGKGKIEDFNAGFVPVLNRGDYHVKISSNINEIRNNGSHKSERGRGEA